MKWFLALLALVLFCNGQQAKFCDRNHGHGDGGELWFNGFGGQVFPFMGRVDGIYTIYSDPHVAINSRLDSANPLKNSLLTVMAEVGIKTSHHEIQIERSSFHKEGIVVRVDSKEFNVQKTNNIGDCVSLVYENDKSMIVMTPLHKIRIELMKSIGESLDAELLNIGFAEEQIPSFNYGGIIGQTYTEGEISTEEVNFIVDSIFSTESKMNTFANSDFVCREDRKFALSGNEDFHMIHTQEIEECKDGLFCVSTDGETYGCHPTQCTENGDVKCAVGATCLNGSCFRNDLSVCSADDQCYGGSCTEDHKCGCLTADSLILMEDGLTEVRADTLKVGDRIYTYPRGAVTVEHIYVHDYSGLIYSMDDSTYFFTADHPFPLGSNMNKTLLGDPLQMIPQERIDTVGKERLVADGYDLVAMEDGQALQYFNKATGSFELKEIKNLKFTFVADMPVYTIYFKEEGATYLSVANGYVNGFGTMSSGLAHEAFKLHIKYRNFLKQPFLSMLPQIPELAYDLFNFYLYKLSA